MKDLNRAEVYSLDGITHEQAEELLQWLIEKDVNWRQDHLEDLRSENSLYYCFEDKEWVPDYCGNRTTTNHISTLFEQSYEEQLIEALERVEELKRKINEPKVGDWVFLKDRGFMKILNQRHNRSLQSKGYKKVTDPFTLETLNNYNK